MIEREGHADALASHDLAVDDPRLELDATEAQNRDFGVIHDRRGEQRAAGQPPKLVIVKVLPVRSAGVAAPLARRRDQALDLARKLEQANRSACRRPGTTSPPGTAVAMPMW